LDPAEPNAPDLAAVVKAARDAGLAHVVIGGFSVIAHGYVRATKDCDLLIPDGRAADEAACGFLTSVGATRLRDGQPIELEDIAGREHLRVHSRHGLIDLIRGGLAPLDFETVDRNASDVELFGETVRIASLESVVGFKRLAGRPQDNGDLRELEAIYGDLPITSIPGLDDDIGTKEPGSHS
jgi:hypothetical protein